MFVSDGSGGYKRFDEEEITPAYKLLPEDKTVYLITDKLKYTVYRPVYHQDKQTDEVLCTYRDSRLVRPGLIGMKYSFWSKKIGTK